MAISHEDREWFKGVIVEALKEQDEHCKQVVADALAKHNMTPRMEDAYQKEIPDLPPKAA